MEQIDEKVESKDLASQAKNPKKNKKATIIISIITVVAVAIAVVLYVYLFKIPYDVAVADFSTAAEQYYAAAAGLDDRNKELDERTLALSKAINAENIPIDELLLLDANVVLEEAYSLPRDVAPAMPEMPEKLAEIIEATQRVLELAATVQAMGDYSATLELLSTTEAKYQSMIDQFETCTADTIWFGVDKERTVLRFVVQFSNPNSYPLRGVTAEWIAYDANDAIVGHHSGARPDIPANGSIYYVGGAGGANLAGTPARVEIRITSEGLLTNRELPQISASNVQVKNNGFNWFTISADCAVDADVNTVDLGGEIIVKDAEGNVIDAEFWIPDNLPDTIPANGKFIMSEEFFNLPVVPTDAEVYMYYVMP